MAVQKLKSRTQKYSKPATSQINFTPLELSNDVSRTVIGQNDAVNTVSTAVWRFHSNVGGFNRHDYPLVYGPTGCGKTLLIETAALCARIPYRRISMSGFSASGFVDTSFSTYLEDMKEFSWGILHLDEFDKASSSENPEFGPLIQNEIMKALDHNTDTQVNLQDCLFVFSGAFVDMEEIVRQRLGQDRIGFHADERQRPWWRDVCEEDFIAFGFKPELIGRLGVHAYVHPLNKRNMIEILEQRYGPLESYLDSLRTRGSDVSVNNSAKDALAQYATQSPSGARALQRYCAQLFYPLMINPKRRLIIDAKYVRRTLYTKV